jgi:NAD(P)-dependent dehydrogenase (short-subunit alcohol dehydrogenase family)
MEVHMQDKRIALVTGANQGIGLQIAKELVAKTFTVLVGSRNLERGWLQLRRWGQTPTHSHST